MPFSSAGTCTHLINTHTLDPILT